MGLAPMGLFFLCLLACIQPRVRASFAGIFFSGHSQLSPRKKKAPVICEVQSRGDCLTDCQSNDDSLWGLPCFWVFPSFIVHHLRREDAVDFLDVFTQIIGFDQGFSVFLQQLRISILEIVDHCVLHVLVPCGDRRMI